MDPASWKLTGVGKFSPSIQVDACSLTLIGELMSQVFSFTWSKLTMEKDIFTPGICGGLPQGDFSSSGLWEGPSEGTIFQPQEFMLINWLSLLNSPIQRSFKTLFPHSKMSDDENDSGKCVATSCNVNSNLDHLIVADKVVIAVLIKPLFLRRRQMDETKSPAKRE